MHAELLDLVFTGATSALLVIGGGAALFALPWRERDIEASERALLGLSGALARAAARMQPAEVSIPRLAAVRR